MCTLSNVVNHGVGSGSGRKVTCYSCREKISVKYDLRITTEAIVKRSQHSYFTTTLSFHANPSCLQDWSYHNSTGKLVNTLPSYHNMIALSPNAKLLLSTKHLQQLDQLSNFGILIKSQPSFHNDFHFTNVGM